MIKAIRQLDVRRKQTLQERCNKLKKHKCKTFFIVAAVTLYRNRVIFWTLRLVISLYLRTFCTTTDPETKVPTEFVFIFITRPLWRGNNELSCTFTTSNYTWQLRSSHESHNDMFNTRSVAPDREFPVRSNIRNIKRSNKRHSVCGVDDTKRPISLDTSYWRETLLPRAGYKRSQEVGEAPLWLAVVWRAMHSASIRMLCCDGRWHMSIAISERGVVSRAWRDRRLDASVGRNDLRPFRCSRRWIEGSCNASKNADGCRRSILLSFGVSQKIASSTRVLVPRRYC